MNVPAAQVDSTMGQLDSIIVAIAMVLRCTVKEPLQMVESSEE